MSGSDRVVDLMRALEESVTAAKEARRRHEADITERCAEVVGFLRRETGPVTAHELSHKMTGEGFHADAVAPNVIGRRLKDLEDMRLARRVGQVEGTFRRPRFLWVAS